MTITFDLTNGKIDNAEIYGDVFATGDLKDLANQLNGCKYDRVEMEKAIENISDFIKGANAKEVITKLFF
jgi:lipoate-protein ligase A